jgi:hypothetical protein
MKYKIILFFIVTLFLLMSEGISPAAGGLNVRTEYYEIEVAHEETFSDETFDGNVYADNYEPVNVTVDMTVGYVGTSDAEYTIPYDISTVNTSSIIVTNSTHGNITYTRTNSVVNFSADSTEDTYTIQYDVKAIKKMSVSEYGTCPLHYTSQTTYCSREVVVTPGSLTTYYYRYFINVSRNETNSSHILHNQSIGIFTSFATRDNLTVRVDDSSVNTTASVIGSTLRFNISNEHLAGSLYSLNEGTYYIDVWYNIVTGTPAGGSGGGGGSGGTVGDGVNTTGECVIDGDCYNIYGYSRRYCVNTSCSDTRGVECWADKDCIYKYGIKKPYCVDNDCKSASEIECWYNSDCVRIHGDDKAYCVNYKCKTSPSPISFKVHPTIINVNSVVGDTERFLVTVINYATVPIAVTLDFEGDKSNWIEVEKHQTLWTIDSLDSVSFNIDVTLHDLAKSDMVIMKVKAKRDLASEVEEVPIVLTTIEGKELGTFCDSDIECLSKSCVDSSCVTFTETVPEKRTNYLPHIIVAIVCVVGLVGVLALKSAPAKKKEGQ